MFVPRFYTASSETSHSAWWTRSQFWIQKKTPYDSFSFYSILENSRRYLQQSHRHSMVPVLSSKLLCPSSVALGNLHRTASSFLFNLVIDRISLLFEERVQSIRGSFLLHHSARRRFQASGFAGISGDEGCVPLQFEAAIVDGACARSALAARPCVQVDFVSMLRVDGENSCPDVVFCGGVEWGSKDGVHCHVREFGVGGWKEESEA